MLRKSRLFMSIPPHPGPLPQGEREFLDGNSRENFSEQRAQRTLRKKIEKKKRQWRISKRTGIQIFVFKRFTLLIYSSAISADSAVKFILWFFELQPLKSRALPNRVSSDRNRIALDDHAFNFLTGIK